MPASDTFHLGVPSLPESGVIGANLVDFFEMADFSVKLDDITDTYDTGSIVLTQTPPDLFVIKISYRVAAAFRGDSEEAMAWLSFGDNSNLDLFGAIPGPCLISVGYTGEIPVNYAATGSDGLSLSLDFHELSTDISTGTLEVWLHYRYNPSRDRLGGKRAK